MRKIYCIVGRTSTGKSTIVKKVSEILNMKILKSYTTRDMRKNETEENSDHIFIDKNDVEKYKNDMVAYTDRCGYCSFATKQQLFDNDFYVINPQGYYELIEKTQDMDIKLVVIYITVPYMKIVERAKKRGDFQSWQENYLKEDEEFTKFEKSNDIDYRILNDGQIDIGVKKMIHIIERDKGKE